MYQDVNVNFTVVCFQNTLYIKHLMMEAGFNDYLNKDIACKRKNILRWDNKEKYTH